MLKFAEALSQNGQIFLFRGMSTNGFSIRVGRFSTSGSEKYEQSASVKKVVLHESYSAITTVNDIAVIQVSTSFKFNDYVKAVCLPTRKTTLATGTATYVTG